MHDDGVLFRERQLFGVEPVTVVVFPLRRDEAAVHAFLLQAQHHHHVAIPQPLAHVLVDLAAKVCDPRGHQRRRADQADAVFHLAKQDQVRPRHAAMCDVATDRHGQALDAALGAADRQRIQKRLRRVFVPPVARVQDRAVHLLRQQVHRARGGVAHDQKIGVHRVQRQRRVDQRLALLHRGMGDRHVHHVRA